MLNDITIERFVEHRDLILPYTSKQLNPNSYDVTLQDTILIFTMDAEDGYTDGGDHTLHGVHTEPVKIDGHYMLQPGQFILGATVEKISLPDNMMARFDGKSSLGRLGLCTHVTAGFIDAGFIGTITVELKNENSFPIMLKPGMRIGQVSFEYLNAASMKPYGMVGHYQHQNAPQPAVEVWHEYQPHRKGNQQRANILRQPLLPEKNAGREVLMETLKLIIGTIILLGFVAAIMVACGAWDTRVFIVYVATAVVVDVICVVSDD